MLTHTRVINIQSVPHKDTHVLTSSHPQLIVTYQNDVDANVFSNALASTPKVCHDTFDMVCCALPVEALENVRGIPEYYSNLWSSVSRNHLIRCYVKYNSKVTNTRSSRVLSKRVKSRHRKRQHTSTGNALTRKIQRLSSAHIKQSALHKCTTTHATNWYQLSYCDHHHADYIYNILRLPTGIQEFRNIIRRTLGKEWAMFDNHNIDVYFWKSGTHSWKPQLVSDNHYSRVLQLDAKLPLFVVGSSLSHYQHWMEGALETVQDAYRKIWRYAVEWWDVSASKRRKHKLLHLHTLQTRTSEKTPNTHRPQVHIPPFYLHNACSSTTMFTMREVQKHKYVVLDGYVYDIRPMMDQHPGSRQLLVNVLGTDISKKYHRIGHSSTARAWAEEHCKGVLRTNDELTTQT
jgi:cytochrome b involved in lipid metabolism